MNIKLYRLAIIFVLVSGWYSYSQANHEDQPADMTSQIDLEKTAPPAKPEAGEEHHQLSTKRPVFAETESEIMRAPLQFISPSVRAFEPETYSIPETEPQAENEQSTRSSARAQARISNAALTPIQSPLEFISPSIRAYPINISLPTEKKKLPFTYDFSGYIKDEAFIDSSQVFGADQSQYLLYPLAPVADCAGDNTNQHGSFNMLAIESRVRGEIGGPAVFGANTFAVIEVDAWATVLLDIARIRLRHGFLYLEWSDKSLLMGQYWHPLILPECFADTIAFNGGAPFDPFSRESQVRLTKQFDTMTFLISAGAHANSPYDGPYGDNTIYARNGILPNINIQLFSSIRRHICGIGVDITRLVPRLITNKNFRANESLMSFVAIAFAAFNWERLGLRIKFIYGQNGTSMTLISGYAVHSIDPYTDHRTYTNTQCLNLWLDTSYKGEVEPGLFLAISKNIGASQSIIKSITEKGITENLIYADKQENIDMIYRIQPRIRWFIKPFVLGAEVELTGAKFGTVTDTARVINSKLVNNFRFLLAAFYVF